MWESIVYFGYILASTFLYFVVPVLPETNKFIVNQAFDVLIEIPHRQNIRRKIGHFISVWRFPKHFIK
jgi:hypothetical protein